MNWCFKCIRDAGLVISAPQVLKISIGCNSCGSETIKSYSIDDVRKQNEKRTNAWIKN